MGDVSLDMSFLEMLDVVNEQLAGSGNRPITFDHDCHEGICGACAMMIDGVPGPQRATKTCQLYMRAFRGGATILVELWSAPSRTSRI